MTLGNILLIIVLIALNAFFVGVEFAAVSSRRSRLDLLAGTDGPAARQVRTWLESTAERDRLIAASQLGITIVSLALGAVGENAFEAWLEPFFHNALLPPELSFLQSIIPALPLAISLIIVTGFHVVLGEQVPKVAVLRSPEKFALLAAPVMIVFGKIFKGFIDLLDAATRMVLGLAGLPPSSAHSSVYSLEEIKQMVSGPEVEGVIEKPERDMLSAIIDFGELVVRQVAIPRTEIIAVEAGTPTSEIIDIAAQNGVTKLPVYEETLDQVIGMVHLRDLLVDMQKQLSGAPQRCARDLARDALFVPETISVNDLLTQFRARRTHIAIVLDEYGGTAGLVTLEDLMEEIVGDYRDPFDAAPPPIQTLPDGSIMLDGMVLINEINEQLGITLADPYYDTIAGFVLGKLGRIPVVGDTVEDRGSRVRLRVESMDHLRVARLSLTRVSE